jgi:hypothetical protein
MRYEVSLLEAAHKHSIFHKDEILNSNLCGCFYCLKTFKPQEIIEWTDEDNPKGETALCPFCEIDSVIGDKTGFPIDDINFLEEMRSFYFS